MEGNNKPIFTTASESLSTATTESYVPEVQVPTNTEGMFSPLAPSYRARETSELMNLMHREPRAADTAPAALHIDNEMLVNFRNNGSETAYDEVDQSINNHQYHYMGPGRPESVASSVWAEESAGGASTSTRNEEMIETFDFLAKSLSSANSFVSMLTREQLALLRGFRPSLLYEFLQETVKLRGDKRLRRAGPNECAFCKNNGENEECYSSHALKDWRGRVLCPVLRAFRCPRCGATGDRAHTIKYCPEQAENSHGLERAGSFGRRRLGSSSASLVFGQQPAATPQPAPTSLGHSSLWNFNMN